jgi:hypothetical protein
MSAGADSVFGSVGGDSVFVSTGGDSVFGSGELAFVPGRESVVVSVTVRGTSTATFEVIVTGGGGVYVGVVAGVDAVAGVVVGSVSGFWAGEE